MRRSVIGSAYLRAAIIVTVIFVAIAAIPGLLHLQLAQADPAGSLNITLKAVERKDSDAQEKAEFLSGEPFYLRAGFTASHDDFPAGGLKLTLKVPKSDFYQQLTAPPDPKGATAYRNYEDTDHFFYEYDFANPQAISEVLKVGVTFKNDATPNNTRFDAELILSELVSGQQLQTKTVNVLIKAESAFDTWKNLQRSKSAEYRDTMINGQPVTIIRQIQANRNQSLKVISDYTHKNYHLGMTFANVSDSENPYGYGRLTPNKVRLVDYLPTGTKLAHNGSSSGCGGGSWMPLEGVPNAVYLDIDNLHECAARNEKVLTGQSPLATIYVDFSGLASGVDEDADNDLPVYVNKLDIYEITPDNTQRLIGTSYRNVAYVQFPFVTTDRYSLTFDKSLDPLGAEYYASGGKLYSRTSGAAVEQNDQRGQMSWQLRAHHSASGTALHKTTWLREIQDVLPTNMVAKTVVLTAQSLVVGDQADQQRVEEALNAGSASIYGIDAQGRKTLIAANVRHNQEIAISNPVTPYAEIVAEFTNPILLENFSVYMKLWTSLTNEEILKFDGEYKNPLNVYTNRGVMKYTQFNQDFVYQMEDSENVTIRPIKKELSALAQPVNPALIYQNCEARNIPKPYTPQNCTRIGELATTYTWKLPDGFSAEFGSPLKGLKSVLLLPKGFELSQIKPNTTYAYTSPTTANWYNNIESKVVRNFQDTGRTALITNFPDFDESYVRNDTRYGGLRREYHLDATDAAVFGNNEVEQFLTVDESSGFAFNSSSYYSGGIADHLVQDIYDINGNGRTDDQIVRTLSVFKVNAPEGVVARKDVARTAQGVLGKDIAENQWRTHTGGIDANSDEVLHYRLQVLNNIDRNANNLTIIDVLPQANDHAIVSSTGGAYPDRNWSSTGSDGQAISAHHSAFETPLRGPITRVELIPAGGASAEDVTDRFDDYYTTEPQKATLDAQNNGTSWMSRNDVADWNSVKAFKLVLKQGQVPEYVIPAGALVNVYTENKLLLPAGKENTESGSYALNSFAMSTDNGQNFQETNKVSVAFVKYKVRGKAFLDADSNGVFGTGDHRAAPVTVSVVDENGNVVVQDGQTLQKVVNTTANGDWDYDFDIYSRGTYRLRFEKTSSQTFTTTDSFYENPAGNHAYGCGATAVDATGGNPDKCVKAQASNNNYAWTKPFTFTPSNRLYERNVGIVAQATGTLTWQKVSESSGANRFLAGSKWRLINLNKAWTITDCVMTEPNAVCPSGSGLKDTDPAPGKFSVTNLAPGDYKLQELEAPLGYLADINTVRTTTVNGGETATFGEIVNKLRPAVTLPLTGGMGADIFLITGGGVMLLGLIATIYLTRRNRAH